MLEASKEKRVDVSEVMTSRVVTVGPKETLMSAATKLASRRVSGAPVLDDGKVVGVLSEGDLLHALTREPKGKVLSLVEVVADLFKVSDPWADAPTVGNAMTPDPIVIHPDDDVRTAAKLMEDKKVKRLPVIDKEGALVGIVSREDLVRMIALMNRPL